MGVQKRDFFVYVMPSEESRAGDSLDVSGFFESRLGKVMAQEFSAAFRKYPDAFAERILPIIREQCWWIRNRRWSGRPDVSGHVERLLQCLSLGQLAGCDKRDLTALLRCSMVGCVCDGCDLASGARFRPVKPHSGPSGPASVRRRGSL